MEFEKPAEDDGNHLNISWDPEEIIQYAEKMGELRKNIYDKAKRNIDAAQKKDKFYYDQKHSDPRVCTLNSKICNNNIKYIVYYSNLAHLLKSDYSVISMYRNLL